MQRAGVYKALMKDVRPRIDTFNNILKGIGLILKIDKIKPAY
jgi:DNA-binding phage protein